MNFGTQDSTISKKLKKRLIIISSIWLFALVTLYSCVLLPLYVLAETDKLLMESALPIVLEWVYPIVDTVSLALGYGFAIYALYEFGFRASLGVIGVSAVATVYKYVADLFISFAMSGESISIDYAYTIFYILLEIALLAIVVAISNRVISLYKEDADTRAKGLRYLGKTDDRAPALPFSKLIDLQNPVQKSIFIVSVIMAAIKVAMRIRLDIFIGMPSGPREIVTMVIYYVSDVLVMPISYIAMSLAVIGGYGILCRLRLKNVQS